MGTLTPIMTAARCSWETKGMRRPCQRPRARTDVEDALEAVQARALGPAVFGTTDPAAAPCLDLTRTSPLTPHPPPLPTSGALGPFYLLTGALICGTPVLTVTGWLCSPINLPHWRLRPRAPTCWSPCSPPLDAGPQCEGQYEIPKTRS